MTSRVTRAGYISEFIVSRKLDISTLQVTKRHRVISREISSGDFRIPKIGQRERAEEMGYHFVHDPDEIRAAEKRAGG